MKNRSRLVKAVIIIVVILAIGIGLYFILKPAKVGDYSTFVPSESYAVAAFDLKQLIKKADMEAVNALPAVTSFKNELESVGGAAQLLLKKIIEKPDVSGVKFDKKLFFFLANDSLSHYAGASVALKNKDAFEKMVHSFIPEETKKRKRKGFATFLFDGWMIGWNENSALLIMDIDNEMSDEEIAGVFEYCLQIPSEKQLFETNKEYTAFVAGNHDIALWLGSPKMIAERFTGNLFDDYSYSQPKGKGLLMAIDFYKGNVKVFSRLLVDEPLKKKIELITGEEINRELLSYHKGDKLLMAVAFTLNMKNYPGFLSLQDNDTNGLASLITNDTGVDAKVLSEVFKGDVVVTLNSDDPDMLDRFRDVSSGNMYDMLMNMRKTQSLVIPDIRATATVSPVLFDQLLIQLEESGQMMKSGKNHMIECNSINMPFYIRRVEDVAIMMSIEQQLNRVVLNGIDEKYQLSTSMEEMLTDNKFALFIDLDIEKVPASWQFLLHAGGQYEKVSDLLGKFDTITAVAGDMEMHLRLDLAGKKNNSLQTLITEFFTYFR